MAIQTVTQENLAEFAASRKSSPPPVVEQPAGDGPVATPGNPVIKAGEAETFNAPPEPGQPAKETKAPKPVQPRIDELVREKKELDEAFQQEYETRLRLEGELAALKSQAPTQPEAKPAPDELGPMPDPKDFTEQSEFLAKYGEWNRKKARLEFQQEQEQERQREATRQAEEAMVAKVAQAQADFPDFTQVIESADRRTAREVPNHIKAAIYESDYGAHIAYHLAKNKDEERRIFALPVAKALLELGKIEQQYAKKPATPSVAAPTPTPEPKPTPAPIARLKEGGGIVSVDLSQPMAFKDYKARRLEEIRARKRH